MAHRFPKTCRLARKGDIDLAYKRGKRISARILRLHVRPNGRDLSRIAISVPRRLCNAVYRNRWKRLIRESFRLHPLEIGPGWDIIVVPLRRPTDLKRQDVDSAMIQAAGRIG